MSAFRFISILSFSFLCYLGSTETAFAQYPLKLEINKKTLAISIKSKNIPVERITEQLSKHYGIVFGISPTVAISKPALNLRAATLETVLRSLAPFAIIEKELIGGAVKPKTTKAFLFAHNENIPVIKETSNTTQVIVFEGNTDITEDSPDADKLAIFLKYKDEKLTLRCKDQPALYVMGRIAEVLAVPLMLGKMPSQTVTADFKDLSIEQAFARLPSSARLRYLVDLNTMATKYKEISLEN